MEQDKTSSVSGAAGSEPNVREYAEAMKFTDLEVESSYVEDGKELNVLVSIKVSPDEKPGDPEPRWTIIADPETREIVRVDFCVATDEGFEHPEYTPTAEQMVLFKRFAKECE